MIHLQQIKDASKLLLQLQTIKTPQSELVLTATGKITTVEKLTTANQYLINNGVNAQKLRTVDACKTQLKDRLTSLEINYDSKINGYILSNKLKDKLIEYYLPKGLFTNNIEQIIANCDNSVDLFLTLLESQLTCNDFSYKGYIEKNKCHINLPKLSRLLKLYITNETKRNLIYKTIKILATDNQLNTMLVIVGALHFDFMLTEDLQYGIINALYGEYTTNIFYQHKNQYEIQKEFIYLHKYQRYMQTYRANGLNLINKYTLAIGSQIADRTGSLFDAETTIFADFKYADLNGDIFNTIDQLHAEYENHNKFKFIAFTHTPGIIFKDIDNSLSLIIKIYDLLKKGGIVLISCGLNYLCREITTNKAFINKILIPANFLVNEIATLQNSVIHQYESYLTLLEKNNKELINSGNDLSIVARKI